MEMKAWHVFPLPGFKSLQERCVKRLLSLFVKLGTKKPSHQSHDNPTGRRQRVETAREGCLPPHAQRTSMDIFGSAFSGVGMETPKSL